MLTVIEAYHLNNLAGVWRIQELPGCAPAGASAMRLTYSVELSPRAWVPVALVEGRIAVTLGQNLECIRDFVTDADNLRRYSRAHRLAPPPAGEEGTRKGAPREAPEGPEAKRALEAWLD